MDGQPGKMCAPGVMQARVKGRERDGGGGVMKYPKLILYFPACPQVDGGSATTGVNWEPLLQVMLWLQLCSTGALAEGGGASWEFSSHGR